MKQVGSRHPGGLKYRNAAVERAARDLLQRGGARQRSAGKLRTGNRWATLTVVMLVLGGLLWFRLGDRANVADVVGASTRLTDRGSSRAALQPPQQTETTAPAVLVPANPEAKPPSTTEAAPVTGEDPHWETQDWAVPVRVFVAGRSQPAGDGGDATNTAAAAWTIVTGTPELVVLLLGEMEPSDLPTKLFEMELRIGTDEAGRRPVKGVVRYGGSAGAALFANGLEGSLRGRLLQLEERDTLWQKRGVTPSTGRSFILWLPDSDGTLQGTWRSSHGEGKVTAQIGFPLHPWWPSDE